MTTELFDIRPDDSSGSWFLDTPTLANGEEILGTEFRRGVKWAGVAPLRSKVYRPGAAVSFSRGGRGTYFVASPIMSVLRALVPAEQIQGIPVSVEGCVGAYEVLNVLDIVDCVDEQLSEFGKWTVADGRPDMVGRYRGLPKMVISGPRASGHELFLVKGWEVSMLCTKRIRDALCDACVTGIKFEPIAVSE